MLVLHDTKTNTTSSFADGIFKQIPVDGITLSSLSLTTIRYPYLKSLCIPGYELKKMQRYEFQGKTVSSTHKNSISHDNRPHEVDRCSFNTSLKLVTTTKLFKTITRYRYLVL